MSKHAAKGVTCLDCHQVAQGQTGTNHNGFVINNGVTPANCRGCHAAIYEQFARSRHAAPSWVAVMGNKDFSPEMIEQMEKLHPGSMKRPPHPLTKLEGDSSTQSGCISCHAIGKPNADGSIGNCTYCHTRHTSSVELARLPSTCGQCHLGPDHSQIEIYTQSKHGMMFAAQKNLLNLSAPSDSLTTKDMFVPTCATCHMSGINGRGVTHDPSERLSYNLFAEVTTAAPERRTRAGQDEGHLPAMPHAAAGGSRLQTGHRRRGCDQQKSSSRQGHHGSVSKPKACSPPTRSPSRFSSPILISGITTGARRNTRRSWAARILSNGTAIIRSSSTW